MTQVPIDKGDQQDQQLELEKMKGLYERRVQRERNARKQAEKLLENKSLELHQKNQSLEKLAQDLEQRVAERTLELEAEKNHALGLSKIKSDFVATMSHEIRTPLNGIIGVLNLLKSEIPADSEADNLLQVAQHSSKTLLFIINDILDFSKIESGKMQLEHTPFNLKETLQNLLHPFENQLRDQPVDLLFEYDAQIHPTILGDPYRLTQVLNNFLSNAFKFTSKGHIALKVFLEGDNLHFEVHDTGIGISQAQQDRLFKEFSQVDTSITRKYGGTGLGLVITQKIVELMGGAVGFWSKEHHGSCFYIQIPYQQASEQLPETATTSEQLAQSSCLEVLLVDDNDVNLLIGEKILTRLGHQVTCAKDGFAAIDIVNAATNAYDVIFMDIQMPELNGFDTTKILRSQNTLTPIIALTANTSQEDKQQAQQAGMDGFLSKPFQIEQLQNLLNEFSTGR